MREQFKVCVFSKGDTSLVFRQKCFGQKTSESPVVNVSVQYWGWRETAAFLPHIYICQKKKKKKPEILLFVFPERH